MLSTLSVDPIALPKLANLTSLLKVFSKTLVLLIPMLLLLVTGGTLTATTPLPILLPPQLLIFLLSPMPVLSSFPRLPLTCIVGVRTLLSLPSYNLTDKTVSLSVRVHTLTSSNLTNTTPVTPIPVSTFTPSPSALRNTNLPDHVTSPVLTTPPFNLFSPTPPLRVPRLPRSVFMLPTTMFFVS